MVIIHVEWNLDISMENMEVLCCVDIRRVLRAWDSCVCCVPVLHLEFSSTPEKRDWSGDLFRLCPHNSVGDKAN